jgi:hypothetical protein
MPPTPHDPALSEEALEFVRKLQLEFAHEHGDDEALIGKLEARLKELEAQLGPKELERIGRRIMMDIMKRPQRPLGARPPQPSPPRGPATDTRTPRDKKP